MLSAYYILQHHLQEYKMRTIATNFNPIFLPIFLCHLIKKLYLCSRIFSNDEAIGLSENRFFSKYMYLVILKNSSSYEY